MCDREDKAAKMLSSHRIVSRDHCSWVMMPPREKVYGEHIEVRSLRWGQLLVHGDWDPVVFGHYNSRNDNAHISKLYWIGRSSMEYVHQKARIASGSSFLEDDIDEWKKDIKRYRREKLISAAAAREAMDRAEDEDWQAAREIIFGEDFELAGSVGMVINWQLHIARAAVSRLCDLLDQEENFCGVEGFGI